jgi:type IV pilus assembly protein PilQ
MNRVINLRGHRRFIASLGIVGMLTVPAVAQDENAGGGFDPANEILDLSGIEVDDFDTFNIQVQDTDLAQVLQMLALQSERNVIASRNVSAVISANLFDVTFYEALDAILKPNGFRWVEEGKFIYVYTQEEFARMEALDRKTESRMFELEHLSAKDASEFATPLLSDRGKLSFIGEVSGGIEQDLGAMGGDGWAKSAILVVNDYPDRLERISELLAEIDTAPRQVVVDATIASVKVTEEDAFGVDFALIGNLDITKLVSPLGPVQDLIRGNIEPPSGVGPGVPTPVYAGADGPVYGGSATPGNVANGKSNMKLGLVAGDAAVFVRALDQVTDTMVLARPRLMALNRQRAQVLVGQRVAYLSTTATDTTTTQTVQYLDTGVKLMLRPFISKDDSIRMELYPSVSSYELRPVTTGGLEGSIVVPDEFTNEISTNVKVKNGQTLVLGGLFQEDTTVTNSQVPFLGDIPLLGAAFSGHDNTVNRREIIFLITPNIVEDELIEESGRQGTAFVNSLRAGMREGLLPFSREKMSSQHNQNAFEAANSGDTELALYHLDNSLRLNPAQPEVRRMRSKLTGQTDGGFYDYDMFNRVMHGMHEEHADRKADEARLDAETDPLAPGAPMQTASSSSEERYVESLVDDLEMPEIENEPVEVAEADVAEDSMIDVEALEEAIFLVEAEPMSVDAAFGEGEATETTSFDETVIATENPVEDSAPDAESTTVTETVVAAATVEESYDDDCEVEPMTTDRALEVVAESQRRLVAGPRNSAWGRLWWLARIAGDQARAFAFRDAESTTGESDGGSAVATVNDED